MGRKLGEREKGRGGVPFRAFLPLPLPYFRLPRRLYFVLHLVMTSSKRIHPFLGGDPERHHEIYWGKPHMKKTGIL